MQPETRHIPLGGQTYVKEPVSQQKQEQWGDSGGMSAGKGNESCQPRMLFAAKASVQTEASRFLRDRSRKAPSAQAPTTRDVGTSPWGRRTQKRFEIWVYTGRRTRRGPMRACLLIV